MPLLHYSVDIAAPVHDVWTAMIDDESYREWTGAFFTGSFFEGSWERGACIRFLGPSESGEGYGGMLATVVENRLDEFISLEYYGQVLNGVEDTESDHVREFAGNHENYAFSEIDGVTTVSVELDAIDSWVEMFETAWPVSLAALKRIAERTAD